MRAVMGIVTLMSFVGWDLEWPNKISTWAAADRGVFIAVAQLFIFFGGFLGVEACS